MKFSCEKNLLLECVSIVSRAVPPKAASPIMEGLLMECYEEGRIKMIGYDLMIGIECEVEADVQQGGTFVVNARMLGDVLRAMDNDVVQFSMDENLNLTISCLTAQYNINCLDSAGFPLLPVIREEKTIEIRQDVLHSMLRQTQFAMADTSANPVLKGMLFSLKADRIETVATNQYKLAIRREPFLYEGEPIDFIIPDRTVFELVRMLDDTDDLVRISLADRQIMFELGSKIVISRLLDGSFLNYERIIPASAATTSVIKIDVLKRSMDRASVLLNNEKIRIPVRFSFEFDSIVMSCRTTDGNTMTDQISAEIDGPNLEIGLNNKYVSEILSAAECDEVVFGLNRPNSPITVTPPEGDRFMFVLSPMHLR